MKEDWRLKIDSVTYWTDSMIFLTLVVNRVATIRQELEPRQWHHLRSKHNLAGYASRGIKASMTKKREEWRNGGELSWKNENEWPPQPTETSEALLDCDKGPIRAKITAGAAVMQKAFWISCFKAVLNGIGCEVKSCGLYVFTTDLHFQNHGLNEAQAQR